jgi:hypothetical protein
MLKYVVYVLAGVGISRLLQGAGVPREALFGLFLLFILGYGGYKLILWFKKWWWG